MANENEYPKAVPFVAVEAAAFLAERRLNRVFVLLALESVALVANAAALVWIWCTISNK